MPKKIKATKAVAKVDVDALIKERDRLNKEIEKHQNRGIPENVIEALRDLRDNIEYSFDSDPITTKVPAKVIVYYQDGKLDVEYLDVLDAPKNRKETLESLKNDPKVQKFLKTVQNNEAKYKKLVKETCEKYEISEKTLTNIVW